MTTQTQGRIISMCDRVAALCAWPGKAFSWLCLGIIVLSFVSVVANLLRWHEFFTWTTPVFLFGTGLTATSVMELQWHLFAALILFAGVYTQDENKHVRVDVLYSRMGPKLRLLVNIVGDTFFLIPFTVMIALYSLDLVHFSFITHEASSEMGLADRWLFKSFLPAAMTLLAVQAAFRVAANLLRLVSGIDIDVYCRDEMG